MTGRLGAPRERPTSSAFAGPVRYSPAAAIAMTLACLGACSATRASAQGIDLTQGGPIQITAQDGIEWRQGEQIVIAKGDARAIRGNVTVTADRLLAWYRKKGETGPTQPVATGLTGATNTEGNEVYRMRAEGNVHIFTPTDQAWGDQATYDLDQAVLVMTGHALKLTTPNDTLTARDTLEYWSQQHMAVARGDAVVVTNDAQAHFRRYAGGVHASDCRGQQPVLQRHIPQAACPRAACPRAAYPRAARPRAAGPPARHRPVQRPPDQPCRHLCHPDRRRTARKLNHGARRTPKATLWRRWRDVWSASRRSTMSRSAP